MAAEQESTATKLKKKSGAPIVLGCALIVLAITREGPLQWVLFTVAIAILGYGVFLASREKKSRPV
jgi:hypothetical protein